MMVPNLGTIKPPLTAVLEFLSPFTELHLASVLHDLNGAVLQGTTDGGRTCYHWLADSTVDMPANDELAALLQASGVDVNARDDHGRTALRNAAKSRSAAMIKWFMEVGADPHIRDNDGISAVDAAMRRGGARSRAAAMKAMGAAVAAEDAAEPAPAGGGARKGKAKTAGKGRWRGRKTVRAAPAAAEGADCDEEQPRKRQRQLSPPVEECAAAASAAPAGFALRKVADLRAECQKQGLATTGKKTDLVARLETAGQAAGMEEEEEEEMDFASCKVVELRAECKKRGLATVGKKADLVARLEAATKA